MPLQHACGSRARPQGARSLGARKTPLRDAAAVNATRWVLFNELKATVYPSRRKRRSDEAQPPCFRRGKGALARCALRGTAQWRSDAEGTQRPGDRFMGRGSRPRTRLTKYGFPRGYLMRQKCVHGFATGDMVEANVPAQRKEGRTVARTRCGPRLGLIQHSNAEGRHSRRRLEALPTDFTQRRIWVRVARATPHSSLPGIWTTHPLSSGSPLFLIPELRAVSGNLRSSASYK